MLKTRLFIASVLAILVGITLIGCTGGGEKVTPARNEEAPKSGDGKTTGPAPVETESPKQVGQ